MAKGTTSGPAGRPRTTEELTAIGKRHLMLYMDIETVEKLDELIAPQGLSRSEAIARYIEQAYLGSNKTSASSGETKRAKSR